MTSQYLTGFRHITLKEKRSITTEIIVAITTKPLQESVIAMSKKLLRVVEINSEAIGLYNKKNLVAINPKHRTLCSSGVNTVPKTM